MAFVLPYAWVAQLPFTLSWIALLNCSTENNIIHTNQPNHYSGLVFEYPTMHAGSEIVPNIDPKINFTQTGNRGDGFARIIFFKKTIYKRR